ncbi:MAG: lysophospholipid acyltransferase family protein [Bacteroidota bacterium]
MKYLAYIGTRFLIFFFSILPFSLIYWLSDLLYVLLYRIWGYRQVVVRQNLQRAFPQYSTEERQEIERNFYRHFCDILLESIKGLSLSEASLHQRYRYTNPELIDQYCQQYGACILTGSHCGNWEWGVLSFPLWVEARVLGIYKPLSNPLLNQYLMALRERFGLHLSAMSDTGRAIVQYQNQATVFVFIADQSPSSIPHAYWIPFLNQDTAFIHGPGKIAHSRNYPVLFFAIRRVKRGYYEVDFELLTDQAKRLHPKAITELYAQRLEVQIRQQPAEWLWTHKRWKRKRPEA